MAQNPIVTIEMENGGIMKAELYPEVAPNTVKNFISLIQKGYITKEQSPDDKREYHLSVTQKYIDYYNVSYRYVSTVMDRIKERFPAEDVAKLEEMLDVISDELMPELNQIPSKGV